MSEEKQMEKRKEERPVAAAPNREWGRMYVPPVDIYEGEDSLMMNVDMPGVDEKSVEVTVESQVLTIEGRVELDVPAGHELARAECQARGYRRVFELSDEIDAAGLKARVKNGVLRLTLPKREEAKSRKIEIEVEG
jgi:HSP20 family protein